MAVVCIGQVGTVAAVVAAAGTPVGPRLHPGRLKSAAAGVWACR